MGSSSKQAKWAFDDPMNVVTVTMCTIILEGQPILLISHSADEDTWQFHTVTPFSTDDAMLVALHEIVKLGPTVCELADLPLSWSAQRESIKGPWLRSHDEE